MDVYEPWGWGTGDADQLLSQMRRFGSVTVLTGISIRLCRRSKATSPFIRRVRLPIRSRLAGVGPGPGPLKVPADQLAQLLGVST